MSEVQSVVAIARPQESRFQRRTKYVRDLYDARSLIRFLTESSLRAEKVSLSFGFLWWLLDPLLRMLVYTLIIVVIFQRGEKNFALFVLCALLPWEYFTRAAKHSIADTRAKTKRMKQVAFPRAVVPLSSCLGELYRLAVALGLYLVVSIPFGIYPDPMDLLVLPLMVVLFAITLGIGYFLAALNLFVPDTESFVAHAFRLMLFLSPVLYSVTGPSARVPEKYVRIYQLNPFAGILESFRNVLFYHQFPPPGPLAYSTVVSLVLLVGGFMYFVVKERAFAKLV